MKRTFLILLSLILTAQIAHCAQEGFSSRKDAYRALDASNNGYHTTCQALVKNFRFDPRFHSYLRNRCVQYEAYRLQTLGVVLPMQNRYEKNYNAKYPIYYSQYAINMNNEDLKQLKDIVQKYCAHNANNFAKKAPQMCSGQKLNDMFK